MLQKFIIFEFFLVIFAQILMKFYRNFADSQADILENVEIQNFEFSEIFEFSSEDS